MEYHFIEDCYGVNFNAAYVKIKIFLKLSRKKQKHFAVYFLLSYFECTVGIYIFFFVLFLSRAVSYVRRVQVLSLASFIKNIGIWPIEMLHNNQNNNIQQHTHIHRLPILYIL